MRDATEEVFNILSDYPHVKFVMHSFTGDSETMHRFVKLGGYISFSGIVTFKNAGEVQDAARHVPIDRILIETDAPFLAPHPHRGLHNKPENVVYIAAFLASLRGEDETYFTRCVYENSVKLFGGDE